MYPVSEAFLSAVQENTRRYYWTGKITTKEGVVHEFSEKDIVKGSGYISSQCCGSTEMELGTVYLRMENGTGSVGIGDCIASISGQAMAAAPAWDGKIEIEEKVGRFAIGGGMNVRKISDVIEMETMELVQRTYTDHVTGRTAIGAFCRPVTVE